MIGWIIRAVSEHQYKKDYGMSAKDIFTHKIRAIIEEYDRHQTLTDVMVTKLTGNGGCAMGDDSNLESAAQAAGFLPTILGEGGLMFQWGKLLHSYMTDSIDPIMPFLGISDKVVDRIEHSLYYLEEEGTSMPEELIVQWIESARLALQKLEGKIEKIPWSSAVFRCTAEERDQYNRLEKLAEKGDVVALRSALSEGVDDELRKRAGSDRPLIHHAISAAQKNCSDVVRTLLDCGCDVNARDEDGKTPLFIANGDVMDLLLQRGAKVDARNKSGKTAFLHEAWSLGAMCALQRDSFNLRNLKTLANNNANINAVDKSGNTVLHEFVSNLFDYGEDDEKLKILKVFLEFLRSHHFALINQRNKEGQTAASGADKKVVEVMRLYGGV